jgi:hypothetical protein
MGYILAAILFLAPQLGVRTAKQYARLIHVESRRYSVDPLLVVALAHTESGWWHRAKSSTSDYGLMQVHVSTTTNPHLIGRQEVLFDPATNIRYGCRILNMWRSWCLSKCKHRHKHHWSAHNKWGYRVKRGAVPTRADVIYQILRERFDPVVTANKATAPRPSV